MSMPVAHNLPVTVAALYKFADFTDPAALQGPLLETCQANDIFGTLLLAHEGVNGTIAGSAEGISAVVAYIRALPGCADLDVKYSGAVEMPFYRMKVRLKREIVTLGVEGVDPVGQVGQYLDPAGWNELISDPDVILIDTRNDYEVAIGTFRNAIDPKTKSFREFPEWFDSHRAEFEAEGRTPKIAMFCTGGIRCEKSTAFVRARGIDEVYHLKGGILRYLEDMPEEESLWDGECFVFDERVAVGHGLRLGQHGLCRSCRRPVSEADRASPLYEEGICCPACHDELDEARRARLAERHRQVALAAKRGEAHIGPVRGRQQG
ncbi:rhodanese-related sulfurtransferase [Aquisediminimonas sediminicola]|uniref:oxygen-dependent tRNA uridine(34) hydroxylase TrhO n=1 Tax=Alteraquisediminimonas sediminicola TaxID=2676787 RepID=UPI003CCEE236